MSVYGDRVALQVFSGVRYRATDEIPQSDPGRHGRPERRRAAHVHVILVGHRCVGKTVTGARLAALMGRTHVDLDAAIERETGERCETLVSADEPAFRALELSTLERVLQQTDVIVSCGAGISELPDGPLVVWLQRDGWEATALNERARLRPQMSWTDEVAWMCTTREPRWLAAAHLFVNVPRGRAPDRVAHEIATYVRWLDGPLSDFARKTWIVPATPAELDRAARDANVFGLAGVEVRSDVITPFRRPGVATLASVRTDDIDWIEAAAAEADAFDVDLANLDAFVRSGALRSEPRPLVLSAHPLGVDPDDVTALATAGRRVQVEHPAWAPGLSLKYAPQVQGFADIGVGRAAIAPLRRAGIGVTYLPQGAEFAWTRPLFLDTNTTNYVAASLRASRVGLDKLSRTPWDLQDWLPHLVDPAPRRWDALIGHPVAQSQGDIWHRRAALEAGEHAGYVKVDVPEDQFDAALALLEELGVHGISVTSPFKSRIAFICPNDAAFGELLNEDARWAAAKDEAPVRSGNTLVRRADRWLVTDTDEVGMAASLAWFEQREIGPATIAMFGGGGVRGAATRAIDGSDWFLVYRCRARDGWPQDKPPFVTLVVNAAGPSAPSRDNPPRSRAWLDLHYADVAEPPEGVVHLIGDVFFDAQAAAQRAFWRDE